MGIRRSKRDRPDINKRFRPMNKTFCAAVIFAIGSISAIAPADAAGCLSGAAVGGVAGHLAGHHAVLGAAAGCAIGHHEANKDARRNAYESNRSGDPSRYDHQ
jgi:hypothetical protein